MPSDELLSRLAPRAQDWDRIPAASVDRIAPEDLAHALGGLPRGPYLLARAVYAQDESVLDELERVALATIASKAFSPSQVARPGFLREVTRCCLADVVRPPKCPRCQGRGHIYERQGRVVACEVCEGGRVLLAGSARICRRLGIGWRRWRGIVGSYRQLEAGLWAWRGLVIGHVRRKLRQVTDFR